MSWTKAYWDNLSNIYWTPRFLGLKSIPRKDWRVDGGWVSVPNSALANHSGPLYSRARKFSELRAYLQTQEEILNQFFNLTFSVAADAVIAELLFKPLGIVEFGAIARLGREVGERYGWSGENITQHDGLFLGDRSIVGVELKLELQTWPEQIAKYVALMVWEEDIAGPREQLGLLFLVPEKSVPLHWSFAGLGGPSIDKGFLGRLNRDKLPGRIRELFDAQPDRIRLVMSRLQLAVLSWEGFSQSLANFSDSLQTSPGDLTLMRLLSGFREALEEMSAGQRSRSGVG